MQGALLKNSTLRPKQSLPCFWQDCVGCVEQERRESDKLWESYSLTLDPLNIQRIPLEGYFFFNQPHKKK